MRVKLSYKIFAALFLMSLVVAVFTILTLRYFAYRNFTDFVNRVEVERLSDLKKVLSEEYQKSGGWGRRGEAPSWWNEIVGEGLSRSGIRISPPVERDSEAQGAGVEGRGPKQTHSHGFQIESRLFLLDERKAHLAGDRGRSRDYIVQGITVDGRVVGWLGLNKREKLKSPVEKAFLRQLNMLFYSIGGGVFIITVCVSLLLSRHLLAPIRKLTEGTRAVMSRRFDTRIRVRTNDELGMLASDFNLMAKALAKYEQMRRQWISDIAHELRTPLSILQGEIEALQDGVREVNPETLASLHGEAAHLGTIVNDLHELSLAEANTLTFKRDPVNPLLILEDILDIFATRLDREGIRILNETGPDLGAVIQGDRDRLTQLFSNLVENTLRYSDSPGTLSIRHVRSKDLLTLSLEDSGPGVPEEALARLFDRLYRVDKSRSRALGGSGLGLSICRSIVENLGGEIRAANGESGGLRIDISFPLGAETHPGTGTW